MSRIKFKTNIDTSKYPDICKQNQSTAKAVQKTSPVKSKGKKTDTRRYPKDFGNEEPKTAIEKNGEVIILKMVDGAELKGHLKRIDKYRICIQDMVNLSEMYIYKHSIQYYRFE